MDFCFKNSEKGFVAILMAILVLFVMVGVGLYIGILAVGEQKISSESVLGTQAYYASEAGIEDALLRINKKLHWISPYKITVGGASATTTISGALGGSRTITSEGEIAKRAKKIEVICEVSTDKISFYYGAQVGDGGLVIGNNATIVGNVFSNGTIISGNGGSATGSVVVARNGNKIKNLIVGGDAIVHTCEGSTIAGTLTYVSGGSVGDCTAGTEIKSRPNEVSPQDLPISQSQIDKWKQEAAARGIISNDVFLTDGSINSLGPIQIGTPENPKNLTVTNNARLKVLGTIYVTGNINFSNNSIIELDNNSYGSYSGTIVADGKINIYNNSVERGSGAAGSYILILSTNNSVDPVSPAINVSNNADGAIFYTNLGMISLSNNMRAREITGYMVNLNNNAVVQYERGLENSNFSGGTGGAWEVTSWKEIE
ncbi:MAG: pilus assembly PilX N-terminal domain-containing protein [Candidatus Pacebacteria bacterium]|nr:pilus assembly PilX N-terminal domain-containing protein [Candidatus Paceibacterota bacterium]